MSNLTTVLFLGGVSGSRKSDNKPFWLIHFAVPSSRSNCFGFEIAEVFLQDDSIYNDFMKNGKPGKEMQAFVRFARGGWDLIDYKF